MPKLPALSIALKLDDKFSKKFNTVSDRIGRAGKKLGKTSKKMRSVGSSMTTGLTLPIVALGAIASKVFVGFDDSMRKVQAITGATGSQFQEMTLLAKKMGETTKFTASQSALGMTYLGMAGLKTNQIMEALPATLDLAAAGGIELAEAADIATNVMTSMGLKTKDLTRITDVLAAAGSNVNTNVLELAEAMRPVAGAARTMGVPLETLVAMLGKMADAGNKGSIAGTLLRNAMLEFAKTGKPIKDFGKEMDKLAARGATAVEVMDIYGKQGGRAIFDLIEAGSKGIGELDQTLLNSAGAAKRIAKIMESGIGGSMRKVISAFEGVAITIGEIMAPALLKLANIAQKFARGFQSLPIEFKQFILIILAVVAVLGPLVTILGLVAAGFSAIMTAVGLISATLLTTIATFIGIGIAIVAVVAAVGVALWTIYKNWDYISKFWIDTFKSVVNYWKDGVELMGEGVSKLADYWTAGFKILKTKVSEFINSGPMKLLIKTIKLITKYSAAGFVVKGVKTLFGNDEKQAAPKMAGAANISTGVMESTRTNNNTNNSKVDINIGGPGAKDATFNTNSGGADLTVSNGYQFAF